MKTVGLTILAVWAAAWPAFGATQVLVIGNSITRHGPYPEIGWYGDWGMAATSQAHDFAHLLYGKICSADPATTYELALNGIANEAAMTGYDHLVPCTADIVIVELGDNYRGQANYTELQQPYQQMLAALKQGHACRVYCLSTWGNPALNSWIQAAAQNQGATYVDISSLFYTYANRAESEGHFTNPGVNWHPGDRGMQAIADMVWQAIAPSIGCTLTVTGTVALQGFFGDRALTGVRFEFRPLVNANNTTRHIFLNSDGTFSLDNITPGTYDIVIQAKGYLTKVLDGQVISTSSTSLGTIPLACGDFSGNNVVGFEDFSILQNTYGQAGTGPITTAGTVVLGGGCGSGGVILLSLLGLALRCRD